MGGSEDSSRNSGQEHVDSVSPEAVSTHQPSSDTVSSRRSKITQAAKDGPDPRELSPVPDGNSPNNKKSRCSRIFSVLNWVLVAFGAIGGGMGVFAYIAEKEARQLSRQERADESLSAAWSRLPDIVTNALNEATSDMALVRETRVDVKRAERFAPNHPDMPIAKAFLALADKDWDQALSELDRAEELKSQKNIPIAVGRYIALFRSPKHGHGEALNVLDSAITEDKESVPLILRKARHLKMFLRYDEALKLYEKARKLDDSEPRGWAGIGLLKHAHSSLKNVSPNINDDVLHLLDVSIARGSRDPDVFLVSGQLLGQDSKFDAAIERLTTAIDISKNDSFKYYQARGRLKLEQAELYEARGETDNETKSQESALVDLLHAMEILLKARILDESRIANCYVDIGAAQARLDRRVESVESFRRAFNYRNGLMSNKLWEMIHNRLGWSLMLLASELEGSGADSRIRLLFEEAVSVFEEARNRKRFKLPARTEHGLCVALVEVDRLKDAREAISRALKLDPENLEYQQCQESLE